MQFLFKIDSIPYGFLVIFDIYDLTVQGLKICILALLAPNNINLWFFIPYGFSRNTEYPLFGILRAILDTFTVTTSKPSSQVRKGLKKA